jgi:predicted PurR-regulated permease PerM
MNESRNGRYTRNLILWVFLAYFLVSLFMLGWLLWPFLSTIVVAAKVTGTFNPLYQILNRKLPSVGASLVTCGIIFFLLFLPIVSLVGILGIIFGPLAVTGFLTLTDIYHASYQNLVEPSKT